MTDARTSAFKNRVGRDRRTDVCIQKTAYFERYKLSFFEATEKKKKEEERRRKFICVSDSARARVREREQSKQSEQREGE